MDLVDYAKEYLVASSWMANQWFSNAEEAQNHRRLQSGPSFVDFVVLVGLGLILYYMLQLMKRFSDNWKAMMKLRIDKALEARKAVKDPFRNTYGYSWDYCMVFDIHDAEDKLSAVQEKYNLKYIIDQLAEGGLQTKLFYSVQNDEVYLKIRAPMKRLQREADRINYRLLLEPTYLGNKLREGNLKGPVEKQWKPVEVPFDSIQTKVEPYEYIYCDYKMDEQFSDLYKKYPNNSIFRGVDRLKLIANIISARRSDGGCFIDVYRLIKDKAMIAFFPLHDAVELRELEERWMRMCELPWKQNVDCVKDYFGEKIAMFFLWLGHYTSWLMPAAIIGFFAWINVAADANNPNSATMPYFATFVALWSTVMLEYWKRKEKGRAMRWGTIGFEDEEQDRPQFEASEIPSPVTGDKIRYFPRDQFLYRITFSVNVIGMLILIVLAIVTGRSHAIFLCVTVVLFNSDWVSYRHFRATHPAVAELSTNCGWYAVGKHDHGTYQCSADPSAERNLQPGRCGPDELRESSHEHRVRRCINRQDLYLPVRKLVRIFVLHCLCQTFHSGH